MVVLVNANLSYSILSFIPLERIHSDFTNEWYTDVGGNIVQTYFVGTLIPYVGFFISIIKNKTKQWLDGGFPCCPRGSDKPKTK